VRNIGKNVAYVMKPTLDSSPMPIHTTKSGSIASGGIRRSSSTTGSTARRTERKCPAGRPTASASTAPERKPTATRWTVAPTQAPLHHLGDGRQQGRLDRAPLLFPRIVGRIDVRDSGRAEAVDLDDRLFFRPGEVRRLGGRDEEAAWRKRLALRLAQLAAMAG